MSFAKKLGQDYESIRSAARFKTIKITINDTPFDLKVRIPVKRELEEMTAEISSPAQEVVDGIYEELSAPLKKTLADADEGFLAALNSESEKIKVLDNDVIVEGNSIRQVAHLTAIWHTQVQRYFGLLQSATGEPINESYDEIAEEFPEAVIKEIIEKIDSAIRPNYKDAKKN
jgi:hypothetical protein